MNGLNVGMLLSGSGIYNGSTIAALGFGGSFTAAPAVAISGAVTTLNSATITVADTTGLVVGQPVTGAGIPANSYIASITNGTTFTLNANATAGATVNLSVAAVTAVTTAVSHGIKSGETIAIAGTGAGIDGNVVVTIDPFDSKRFVFAAVPTNATGTLSIDPGKRFLMSQAVLSGHHRRRFHLRRRHLRRDRGLHLRRESPDQRQLQPDRHRDGRHAHDQRDRLQLLQR